MIGAMKLEDALASYVILTRDPVAVGYQTADRKAANLVWLNEQFTDIFGYDMANGVGLPIHELISPGYRRKFLEAIRPHLLAGDEYFVVETQCQARGGRTFWTSLAVSYLPEDEDGGRLFFASHHDLSHLKDSQRIAEQAVRESRTLLRETQDVRARLRLAIDAIPTPLAIWDRNWRLVVSNAAFAPRLLAQSTPLKPGTRLEDMLHIAAYSGKFCDALGREEEWIEESVAALKAGPIDDITRYSDGAIFRAISMTASNGDTIVYTADITEFTEQRRALEVKNMQLELARAEADLRALHDELTSLGNRRFIGEGLQELLEEREVKGGEIAALAIDLDRFKQINDTLGHKAGDFVLVEVARRLGEVVGGCDLLGRIGGDEFVILRRVSGPEDIPDDLGRKVVEVMSQPFRYEDGELRLGASVGISLTPLSPATELLTNADIALYKAKSAGRGAVVAFDERDLHDLKAAKQLSDELLDAVEKRAFVPYFQPQVDAATGQVVGLEVLGRWNHHQFGCLSLSEVIKTAAELRVIEQIDDFVFRNTLELFGNHVWPGEAPGLSFNVSEERLMSPRLASDMAAATSYAGRVSVELLETLFLDDRNAQFHMQLDLLRDMGIGVEIDDFGSGRTSIISLEQIAPDRLKIDRRLVERVTGAERSIRLMRSIVEIGHALGIGVTAEGVETEAQRATLTRLGCDRLQGHLFGEAMSFEDLVREVDFAPRGNARARSQA